MQNKKTLKRKRWDDHAISETLQLLNQFTLKESADKLGVSYEALLKALKRNHISPRKLMRHLKPNIKRSKPTKGFMKANQAIISDFTISMIADREKSRCAWPIGDICKGDLRFCNAPCVKGSYCLQHYEKAYKGMNG